MSSEQSRGSLPLLEEAAALALAGAADEALKLLDGAVEPQALLLRARILILRAHAGDAAEARALLEGLSGNGSALHWRADLALARLDASEGKRAAAAGHLKRALDGFRAGTDDPRDGSSAPLARMLLHEVDRLERSRTSPSAANDRWAPDPAALLRLIETGKRLAAETDPTRVLRIVLHEAIELSGLDRGFLVLVNDESIDFALAENLDWSEVERPTMEVSRTLVRTVVERAAPVFLRAPETAADSSLAGSLGEIGVQSVACVPMIRDDATLGVLYLDGRDASHAFSRSQERLIELFASQAAAALENARAHRAKSDALEAAEAAIRRQASARAWGDRYFALIGGSDRMQEVYERLERFRRTEAPVLILGETGTGKELVARLIHSEGPRRERAFVAANCAGMAENLLESELFGHERGAFTGAERAHPGLFEAAHRGTLFLDEVGDMSPRMQGHLLRALQSGEVRRVGGRETKRVDVRVVAATHRDLQAMVRDGLFRQDLFFRLAVLEVKLPALRDREGDLALLLKETLHRLSEGRRAPEISEPALRRLSTYGWPGNVRELENVARRLMVLDVETIFEEHLPPDIGRSSVRADRTDSLRRVEEDAIRRAVEATGGRRAEAARLLGIDRKTLYLKLKRLGSDR